MIFSKFYICPAFCLLAHMFVVGTEHYPTEGSFSSLFKLKSFRRVQVLDGLFLHCHKGHFKDKCEFEKITNIPSDTIKELVGIAKSFLDFNDFKTLEIIVWNKYFCTLKKINFWYSTCKNYNYDEAILFPFFEIMKKNHKALSGEHREKNSIKHEEHDLIMYFDQYMKDLPVEVKRMFSQIWILPARFKKDTLDDLRGYNARLHAYNFHALVFIRLFNMFLIEKYYQENQPAVFKKLSQSNSITLNVDDYSYDELEGLQRLKIINLCILDLCKRVEEQVVMHLKNNLEERNILSDQWLQVSIKCDLLNYIMDKNFSPAMKYFLFAFKYSLPGFSVLRLKRLSWEGEYEGVPIMARIFARFIGNSMIAEISFLEKLLEQLQSLDFQKYQQQKETVSEKCMGDLNDEEAIIFNISKVEKLVKQASWFAGFQFFNDDDDETVFRSKMQNQLKYMRKKLINKAIIWLQYKDSYTRYLEWFERGLKYTVSWIFSYLVVQGIVLYAEGCLQEL